MLSNAEFGKYLKQIRENKKLSLRIVETFTGIGYTHLSMIENGKRNFTPALLRNLAALYGVDYLDLYEKAGYIDLIEDEQKSKYKTDELGNPVISIPVLGTVKAGYDYLAEENWIGSVDIKKQLADTGEFFALKIHGDSMSPVLIENDIVIVKKQDDFENGNIVVALINGDEATVKKGKKSDTSILLQPLNSAYEPLIFTKEEMETIPVKIIGIVKKLDREF